MLEKRSPQLDSLVGEYGYFTPKTVGDAISVGLDLFVEKCHADSYNRGWYLDPITGRSLIPDDLRSGQTKHDMVGDTIPEQIVRAWFPYVIATKIALIHSEASEMLEAFRTDSADDKIPDFQGITAEAADVMIRVGDLMAMLRQHSEVDIDRPNQYNLSMAIYTKMNVNNIRPDHAIENRRKPGGKKF